MAKKIIKLDEKSLNSIIKESTMMVLKEWEDLGDESYRDLNIYDCVHNLNVNSAKAENDEKNSEWWLSQVYKNAKQFIELYENLYIDI